ncbi:MAG TPA: ABC transporter permease [Bryobacteraceae bacterium]|jgi:predicted permease|nr:ABC transporter permease [Bryobacteraceae bacterium]
MRRRLDILRLRLRTLFRRGRVESELDKELAFHFAQQLKENAARGMPEQEAREAAWRALGGYTQVQEECRDMRRTNFVESLANDLRYALRSLLRTPAFTAIIVLTLALSIGANSAIFSVIQGVLLRPLAYPQADRLVRIYFKSDTQPKFPLNPNDFLDFRQRNRTFESVAVMTRHDVQLSGRGEPAMLRGFQVSAGYFHMLGIAPARGRDLTRDDELHGRGRSAVISDSLWRTRFSADPSTLGRTVMLDQTPFTVVGIMPPGVEHPGNTYHALAAGETVDIWCPFDFGADTKDRGSHYLDAFGRLKPGVSAQQATADLSAVLSQMSQDHPNEKQWRIYTLPLFQETVGRTRNMLLMLFAAVGVLLLIACVNAANLLLARASARVREIAVRSALGAARTRIVRQLLTESMAIAVAGAALGTLFAFGGVRALVSCLPRAFPRAGDIHLDFGVFAFTLAVAVLTGLLFGLAPALIASGGDLQNSLREGGRGTTSGGRQSGMRSALIVGESALACMLLIGTGLLLHSFVNLLRTDPGFHPQHVLTASIALPQEEYRTGNQRLEFFNGLIDSLRKAPGVVAVGVGSDLPWTGWDENYGGYTIEGRSDEYNSKTTARYHGASPDYFRALGIPLIAGRYFDDHDTKDSPKVVVINETMAKKYWPGEDAVGKRISFEDHPAADKDWIRIVGVVKDVKDQPDSNGLRPAFWIPHAQFQDSRESVAIDVNSSPSEAVAQLRQAVRQLDPDLAISDVRYMQQIADDAYSSQRFALYLVALFAALALALATFGMYGVISYSVNRRMGEFGLRMALGARPGDLKRMIVRQGLTLAAVGTALGLASAIAFGPLLGTLLYGVRAIDPVTLAAVATVALASAAIASYLPARRATSADPLRSLRTE